MKKKTFSKGLAYNFKSTGHPLLLRPTLLHPSHMGDCVLWSERKPSARPPTRSEKNRSYFGDYTRPFLLSLNSVCVCVSDRRGIAVLGAFFFCWPPTDCRE
ncbi:hypothetical protein AVEN_163965-1 [Araneus ventricosus]|uniref:Uncharacterized protein n=1 Tax=Araneus ventricosus TaxID=182803 RepID=A0A4Y2AZN0_ARAVE|nr:hypothetical protein AVEN_163965-1 [Araneus ventricosus]